jgi:hypothetical protein
MLIEEVLPHLRQGRQIRRKCWEVERKSIKYFEGADNIALLADDWEVVKEKVKKTVWVNIYIELDGHASAGAAYSSKEEAEATANREAHCYHGAFPIEIEIEVEE